jgi:hypothetical protein
VTRSALDAALALAGRGWQVFPLKARDKIPATRNGFKDASSDPDGLKRLFCRPDLNLGLATGPGSGLWVLDLDGADGISAFEQIEQQHGKIPQTVEVRTGGGGRHLYFRLNGEPIKNRSKVCGVPIDVRGDGGYVVAPPSMHKSGSAYEWINSPDKTALVEAPSWLVDLVLDRSSTPSTAPGRPLPLEIAPAETKGGRHEELLRLVGAELARGTNPEEVRQRALSWGARCRPALEESEVKRIYDYCKRKHDQRLDELDEAPLPPPPAWPELDQAAYHGLAGDLVRRIEPETESDPAGLLVGLLLSWGNLVGRSPYFVVEGTEHRVNLYAVLVGATSKGRKGTSEGRVRQILEYVDTDWSRSRIVNGLVSGEGLVWNVRDPIYETKPIKEKGSVKGYETVETDSGVEDKRLLVYESEYGSVLRVCKRETSTLSTTIRSAWDTGELRTLSKNSPARATGAHVSILGSITKEELTKALLEVESFSGFSNRFLWVLVRRSKLLPDGGADLNLSWYAAELARAARHARTIERMRRDSAATRLWHAVYGDLSGMAGGLLGAVTSRAEAQVLRLSMIYALLDRSSTISEEHLRAGLAVWDYCRESAALIFGRSTGNTLADQVLKFVRDNPGCGRKDLHRLLGNHVKADSLLHAIGVLRNTGLIQVTTDKSTGGRPAERYYPCDSNLRTNELSPSAPAETEEEPCEQSELSELSPSEAPDEIVSSLVRNSETEMEEFIL